MSDLLVTITSDIFVTHCDCGLCKEPSENDLKFEAGILLSDPRKSLVIPTYDEWIGFNLLDRDGGLESLRKDRP